MQRHFVYIKYSISMAAFPHWCICVHNYSVYLPPYTSNMQRCGIKLWDNVTIRKHSSPDCLYTQQKNTDIYKSLIYQSYPWKLIKKSLKMFIPIVRQSNLYATGRQEGHGDPKLLTWVPPKHISVYIRSWWGGGSQCLPRNAS